MTEERFFQIVEAYGANPARWPEGERAAAMAFADAHPGITDDVLRAESALDDWLVGRDVQPSELLERRILNRFPAPAASPVRWQVPAAAAAALLVGAFIGFASGALTVTEPMTPTLYAAADAYAGLDEDWITWLGDDV
ncbi:MAG: hypothetical protein VX529_06135 [Pseudomonadota bacterium]|nr:hypothetical protein [Pseudomonadota bacterium]